VSERKKRVLVADRSEAFVMYVSIVLHRLGFRVVPAEDGEEALKLLKLFTPDVAILNPDMPGTDGVAVLRRIREDASTAGMPVVVVSDSPGDIPSIGESGATEFLSKPLRITRLCDILEANGGKRRRSLRMPFNKKVMLTHQGGSLGCYAVDLSEGGIYIRKKDPLPDGSDVTVTLPIGGERSLVLNGSVIYRRGLFGEDFTKPPGMAIEFRGLRESESDLLRSYVLRLLAEDILEEQEEQVITI
jgi:CheY-like chemotaxis protein